MDKERFLLLKSELMDSYKTVEEIYSKIGEKKEIYVQSEEGIESMAYKLHNLYGAYEELFEIVAGFFENQIEGVQYHSDLLKRMKLRIEGIRPNLISEETSQLLDELRRFRHFFRHTYSVEINIKKVEEILSIAIQVKEKFKIDFDNFLKQLEV